MLIDFNEIREITLPGMNGGAGTISAKMFVDTQGKIIYTKIHSGGSIGLHKHGTSDDINYVVSGEGRAVCDEKEEALRPGVCHVCKKVSEHSIINTGTGDLVLITVVVERQTDLYTPPF